MAAQLKVLCVDDHPDAARTVGELLQLHGCEVRTCLNGPDALAVAAEFCPDVCVIDLTMPGMDGEELARRLQELCDRKPTRCIALTGQWSPDAFHRTHNVGFDQHLVKPADPHQLVDAVFGRVAV